MHSRRYRLVSRNSSRNVLNLGNSFLTESQMGGKPSITAPMACFPWKWACFPVTSSMASNWRF